jgi:hypothetical protein
LSVAGLAWALEIFFSFAALVLITFEAPGDGLEVVR